jgi:septum formation protein
MNKLFLTLASSSPRRRELLEQHGYAFQVIAPSDTAECGICSRETPPELVCRLAQQKAKDVAFRFEQGLFLGADTVAECMGSVLGKPVNREHARQMLKLMSGRIHHVYSGICLWRRPDDFCSVSVATTKLRMDDLDDTVIDEYLETGAWQGKAGAFGYQDGLDWVHIISGSESNVVGLPMELLEQMLHKFESESGS